MTTTAIEKPPASRKRKRVSKNRKKAWAKHSDITDVEDFLEEKRMQERTGGLAVEKANEQLFFIDKQVTEDDKPEVPVKRSKKYNKPLRCHANLLPDPRIEPGRVQRNFRKENDPKKTCLRKRAQQEKGTVSATRQMSAAQRKDTKAKKRRNIHEMRTRKIAKYDLWGDEVTETGTPAVQTSPAKAVPRLRRHPTKAAAVEVPHPGASYNPSYDDHQELLTKAVEVEIVKDKEEMKLIRALDDKFPKKTRETLEADWMKEMSAGLFEEQEWEEEEEGKKEGSNEEEGEVTTITGINPPVRRDKEKTENERRKMKIKKEEERKVRQEKEKKLRKNEIFRLKSIKAQVREREKDLTGRADRRAELKAKKEGDTKTLGKLKYEAPNLELKLSDELEGSLRLLKPEGNLLEDRFYSLQKRNIIEPRKRAKFARKYKWKSFEKKGHREIVE